MKSKSHRNKSAKNGGSVKAAALKAAELPQETVPQSTEDEVKPVEQDAWISLGIKLRTAREQKEFSVVELAELTRVHTGFIKAFEAGRDLGVAETYSRGYLKLIAQGLDLCSADLLESYQAGLDTIALKDQQAHADDAKVAPHGVNYQTNYQTSKFSLVKTLLDHISQVCSEALGALVSLYSGFTEVFRHSARKTSRAIARRALLQTAGSKGHASNMKLKAQAVALATSATSAQTNSTANKKTASRPTALMASGSSWATNAWSPFSWFGFINGAVVSTVVVGVIVAASMQMQEESPDPALDSRVADTNIKVSPLGELAPSAIAEDSGELSLLNGAERRVALAMMDRKEGLGISEDVSEADAKTLNTSISNTDRAVDVVGSGTAVSDSRFAAIEVESNSSADSAVTSVISLGNVYERNSSPQASYTQFTDSFEPVGPGAEYMVSQYAAQDRLVISVYEDSWVDVRDADGVSLYRALAKAGRRIDLNGELPFSLHVGNAPGLGIELNGEYVPIEQYRSDNSARLTLASSR